MLDEETEGFSGTNGLTKRTLYGSFLSAMDASLSKIELVFYRSASGNEPVREWLLGLSFSERRAIGLDLQRVQYRWPVGMPLVRPMGKGLFEVRSALPDGKIARVFFLFP